MAGTDLKSLQLIQDSNDIILNNAVADDSITPDIDNGLRADTLKTLAFFGVDKFDVIPSGVPNAGEISFNGSDFDVATSILIHKTDAHGNDLSNKLDLIDADVVLQVQDYEGNAGEWVVVSKVDNTTYFTVTVTANGSNPSYTPTSLEGFFKMTGGAGGGGGSNTNVMLDDLTMDTDHSQDMDSNTMTWFQGQHELSSSKIYLKALRDLGNVSGALDISLASDYDAMEMVVTGNFTINFTNLLIGSGFINVTIGGTGGYSMSFGDKIELKDNGTPIDVSKVVAQKDRIYWTCDGNKVELTISKDLA